MTAFGATVAAEWTKFRTARSTVWTTAVMALLWPALAVIVALTDSLQDDDTILGASLTGAVNAQIAAGIVGALMLTSEYRTGAIRTTLTATPRRGLLLAAKAIVAGSVVFAVTIVMAAVAFGLGWMMLDRDLHPRGDPFPAVLGVGAMVAVTSVIGLALGTMLRHSAGSVTAVIVLLLLPSIIGPLLGDLERWVGGASPTGVIQKLTQTTDAADETVGSLGGWPSLALVAVGAAVLAGGATRVFKRRDA